MHKKQFVYRGPFLEIFKGVGVYSLILGTFGVLGYSWYDITVASREKALADGASNSRIEISRQIDCYRKLKPIENLDCIEEDIRKRDEDLAAIVVKSDIDYCERLDE